MGECGAVLCSSLVVPCVCSLCICPEWRTGSFCEPVLLVCPKGLRVLLSWSGPGGVSTQPPPFLNPLSFALPLSLCLPLVCVLYSVGLLCLSCSLFISSCLSLSSAPSSPRRAGGSLSAYLCVFVRVILCLSLQFLWRPRAPGYLVGAELGWTLRPLVSGDQRPEAPGAASQVASPTGSGVGCHSLSLSLCSVCVVCTSCHIVFILQGLAWPMESSCVVATWWECGV